MKNLLTRVLNYIFRGWEEEPEPPHPLIRFLPPFLLDVITFLIYFSLLYLLLQSF